jgi:hypothetical protein
MSPIVIILLLLAALWVISRVSDGVGDFVQRQVDHLVDKRVQASIQRLRAEAHVEGRATGSSVGMDIRLKAGAVDLVCALAVALVAALAQGIQTVTEYSYSLYSGTQTSTVTTENFSFGLFLLIAAVAYVALGFNAAYRSATQQTFGQRLFDYAPRTSAGGMLPRSDLVKRHVLRLAAAPNALVAASQGRSASADHDGWTKSQSVTLGAPRAAARRSAVRRTHRLGLASAPQR